MKEQSKMLREVLAVRVDRVRLDSGSVNRSLSLLHVSDRIARRVVTEGP
jgi:hypothetical protein